MNSQLRKEPITLLSRVVLRWLLEARVFSIDLCYKTIAATSTAPSVPQHIALLCSPANQYPVAALKQRTALVHPLADAAGLLAQRNPVCSGGTYGGTSFCFSVLIKLALMSGGIILGCVRQDSYKFYRNCFNCWRRVFVRQETQMKLASCSMCDPSYALRSAIVVHACLTWRRPPTKVKLCFTKAQLIRRLGPRQTVNGFVLGKQAQPGHFEEGRS